MKTRAPVPHKASLSGEATPESDGREHVALSTVARDHVPHEQVLVSLRRIIRAVDLRSKELMAKAGITAPQLVVLQTVGRIGPVTVGRVASEVTLSQGTVTTIINRMETKGLVWKARSTSDRRRVFVSLTDEGRATLDGAPELLQDHFIKAFGALQPWEQNLILSSFQRVAEMMDVADMDAAPLLETGGLT